MAKKPAESKSKATPAVPGVIILYGPEGFLQLEHTRAAHRALEALHGQVDQVSLDGTTAQPADVLDECRSPGLLAGHKLIVIDNAENLVKEASRPLFERYAQAPAPGATLVLRAHAWRPGKLDKIVEELGGLVRCEPPSEGEAAKWAVARAKDFHASTIDPKAASELVSRVGVDMARIESELAKLSVAAQGGTISTQLVNELVGVSREEEVWGLQSKLLTGKAEEALAHLRHVLDISRQPPTLAMYAAVDLARKLHGASGGLRAGRNGFELTKSLRLWGPSGNAVMQAARGIEPRAALRLLREAIRADQRVKSGLGDPVRSLEVLTVRFVAALAPSR